MVKRKDKKIEYGERAISPLIATVLLIGFTVALAAIVMTWGGQFIKKTTGDVEKGTGAQLACVGLDYEIESANCGANKVTVYNKGSVDISNLKIRVHNTKGVETVNSATEILIQDTEEITVSGLTGTGTTQIDVIGFITPVDGGESISCPGAIEEYICPAVV